MTAGYLSKELAQLPPEAKVHIVIGSTDNVWRDVFTLTEAKDPAGRVHGIIVASPQKHPGLAVAN